MFLVYCKFSIVLFVVNSLRSTQNIAYSGPFNPYHSHQQPHRVLLNTDSSTNVTFYHGVASGDPTSEDLIVCMINYIT